MYVKNGGEQKNFRRYQLMGGHFLKLGVKIVGPLCPSVS